MWAPGDIAECVRDDWFGTCTSARPAGPAPRRGSRYVVASVTDAYGCQFLGLVGLRYCWFAPQFRKIVDVGYEEPRRATAVVDA